MKKLLASILLISASILPAQAKPIGRMTTTVTERTLGVYSVVRSIVPSNGNSPLNLIYMIDCINKTQVGFDADNNRFYLSSLPTRRGATTNSLPTWQARLCDERGYPM